MGILSSSRKPPGDATDDDEEETCASTASSSHSAATGALSPRLEPGAGGIFANFSLLLTEEPDMVDLGTIAYMKKEDKAKAPLLTGSQDEDDEDVDIIHLEITLDAFCSPTCKGLSALSAAQTSTRAAAAATEKNHRPVMLNDEDLSKTS